jgi:hypothetical protein
MPFVSPLGTVEVLVPASQSIIVGSFGPGTTKVATGIPNPANNLPVTYSAPTIINQGSVTLGPFASATMVRIDGSSGCTVEYAFGSAPQLAQANVSDMPSIQMGAGQHFLASATDGMTAHAGGGQGSATPLLSDINRVTTVASAGDSVGLPVAVVGMEITVSNAAAVNSMNVFPASSEQVNAGGANAAFAVAAGKTAQFSCAKAQQWHALLSA